MNTKQVKQLILHNQHLTNPVHQTQVAKNMCGLQAQFFNNPKRALQLRSINYNDEAWQMDMIKTWTLRGTLHMIHKDDYALFMSLQHMPSWFESYNQDLPMQEIEKTVHQYLKNHDTISRQELKSIMENEGYPEHIIEIASNGWGGIFMKMCHQGGMVFSAVNKRDFKLYEQFVMMDEKKAKTEVLKRYFQHYGPATINDAAYFTKFKKAEIKEILYTLPVSFCEVEDQIYYYFETKEKIRKIPEILLLGAFDPLMLGYDKKKSLFLKKEHIRGIFNLTGIVFAPILYNGEVIGRWKKEKQKVQISLFHSFEDKVKDIIYKAIINQFDDCKEVYFEIIEL